MESRTHFGRGQLQREVQGTKSRSRRRCDVQRMYASQFCPQTHQRNLQLKVFSTSFDTRPT